MSKVVEETLTLKDLSTRWKKGYMTVWAMASSGDLPFLFKVGSQWRARLEDVIKFEDSKKVKPPKKTAR